MILSHQSSKTGDSPQTKKMFALLMKCFEVFQSETTLIQLFGTMKNFVFKFSASIFSDGNVFCNELCHAVLKQCASSITSIRQYAATLLYLLMKKNYEATKQTSLLKVRVQITVALSKLTLREDTYLRKSLATVIEYSLEDDLAKTKFPKEVKEAADKLFLILRDQVKINEFEGDLDMVIDMRHRIAQGYMNAPDLRLATLEAIVKLNMEVCTNHNLFYSFL